MTELKLKSDFPSMTLEDWHALVTKGLRGAAFETLNRQTEDGIQRGPISTSENLPKNIAPLPRAGAPLLEGRPWHITAHVSDPDIAYANKQALEDLGGGASALRLSLCERGITIKNKNEMKRLLDQVYTDLVPLIVGPNNKIENAALFDDFKDAHICLGLGPKSEGLEKLVNDLPRNWRLLTINAARVHDTGGSEAQELAYFAASAAHAFRRLGKDAAKHMGAELTTNQDGHLSIAKLRAARRIYASIAQAFGVENAALSLHAVTSTRMMQSIDPWTNMLRVMSAGFGAIIGGADMVTTRPFTDGLGQATPFAHRIARNMQLMMMEESRIENIDPFKARIKATAKSRDDKAGPILGVTLHPAENNRDAKIRRAYS